MTDMSFIVYEMDYTGDTINEDIQLRNFTDSDYDEYKKLYEDSFFEMRKSLGLPRECCKSCDEISSLSDSIFILEENGSIFGSVAVYGNEIDDLFVSEEHRKNGYGRRLLRFAVEYLQKRNAERIFLHVADVNRNAVTMYLQNGFVITHSKKWRNDRV